MAFSATVELWLVLALGADDANDVCEESTGVPASNLSELPMEEDFSDCLLELFTVGDLTNGESVLILL